MVAIDKSFWGRLIRSYKRKLCCVLNVVVPRHTTLRAYLSRVGLRLRTPALKIDTENYIKIPIIMSPMNQLKKILVIPSWYPTTENQLCGSFFKEQTEVMESLYEMLVVYGEMSDHLSSNFFYTTGRIPLKPKSLGFVFKTSFFDTEKRRLSIIRKNYERCLLKLAEQGWRPDVIHAHSTVYGGIVAAYLGKKYNIPVMITEHQMFLLHNYSKYLQHQIVGALEAADIVAAVSSDKKRAILMHGIKCDPVVVGNMVDETLFKIIPANSKGKKLFKILIVAGSSYIKDLPTFFKSIKQLVDGGNTDIGAIVLGGGLWGGENLEEMARGLGVFEYCSFIDSASREEMVKYYNECDVFVSTSIAEGFQVSILEAMACGKPVVSTAHGGVEDILCEENGILVPVRDYKAVADAISKIKCGEINYDPKVIRDIVVKNYGKESFKEKISGLYQELIKKR